MLERLLQTLCCPHDRNELHQQDSQLICDACGRTFSVDRGIVRFIDEDTPRPHWSRALLEAINESHPEMQTEDYYRERLLKAEDRYRDNPALREVVDALASTSGVALDIASGPSGGFLPLLAPRLPEETLLIGTDACPPVIEHWYTCISEIREAAAYLDVDLLGPLPFADASIDLVTGVYIENVNIDKPMGLISELARCTKHATKIVLQQLFYAEESATAVMLRDQGNPYASLPDFADALASVGFGAVEQVRLRSGRGKLDPGDALPLRDSDEWNDSLLIIRHT